jgi:hypothetical protein
MTHWLCWLLGHRFENFSSEHGGQFLWLIRCKRCGKGPEEIKEGEW